MLDLQQYWSGLVTKSALARLQGSITVGTYWHDLHDNTLQ